MKAKDTVMKLTETGNDGILVKTMTKILGEQAEISFKAGLKHGIWLFAWWKDGVQYVGTSGRTLEQAYKELGLE